MVLARMVGGGNLIWHQGQLVSSSNPRMNDLALKYVCCEMCTNQVPPEGVLKSIFTTSTNALGFW